MENKTQAEKSQGDVSANNSNQNKQERSLFAYSGIVFTEYAYAKHRQHFMTINTRVDGKKVFLGKAFKTYDKDAKKYIYTAVDREGNAIFEPTQNLYELKKKFIDNEKSLVLALPQNEVGKEKQDVAKEAETNPEQSNRAEELSEVRKGKEKSRRIER